MSAAPDTILVFNTRDRVRDIELPVLWWSAKREFVVVRTGNRFTPYRGYHVGTGLAVPDSWSAYDFGTQKINKAFAQWFEDEQFFDTDGKPTVPAAVIKRRITQWGPDTSGRSGA